MRALCALWLAASSSVGAQERSPLVPPLTLDAALLAAQARSQALPAQDAAAAAARHQALAARRLPDPMLRLSIENLPTDGPRRYSLTQEAMTMRSVGLTQTLVGEDKRQARAARFEREADLALATKSMRLVDLRRNTALAWFDRYYQQQMVDLLIRQRTEAAAQVESADAAFRAGRGAQSDVFLARAAVARMDDRLLEARTRLANAVTSLRRWVGEVAAAPLGPAPLLSQIRPAAHALVHQLDRHPDIAQSTAKVALAQANANLARQDKHADWSVSLMYGQRGPAYSNMISVGVSVPLQWDQKNRQDRELAAKLSRVAQARMEREEMVRAHLAETQRWLDTWRSDLDRLDSYDATLIPLAAQRSAAVLAAYRGGKASLSNVIEARRMEIDTRIERLRIEMETAALWVELEYLAPDAPAAANTLETQP